MVEPVYPIPPHWPQSGTSSVEIEVGAITVVSDDDETLKEVILVVALVVDAVP